MTSLSKRKYYTLPNEFSEVKHASFTNLVIRPDVGLQERAVALIKECRYAFSLETIACVSTTHGGYIPIQIAPVFQQVFLEQTGVPHAANVLANIQEFAVSNILLEENESSKPSCSRGRDMVYLNGPVKHFFGEDGNKSPVVLSVEPENHNLLLLAHYSHVYTVSHTPWRLYIPEEQHDTFCDYFSTYLNRETRELSYDNLNHFCMIVKNGGAQLEEMLQQNMPNFDEWTIVDTGSTDETVAIIERTLVGKKRGQLYHRPFTNFRDTRNLCFDLAEKQSRVPCKHLMMLDDTYIVRGDLRRFLMEVRGDQVADSFSLYVSTDDTQYASNRILRTETRLRYKHKIHEVLDDNNNVNVIMFKESANILDRRFPYMETRTMDRKRQDLEWLKEEIRDNPTEPRHYYYLAQTYNLLGEHQKAFEAFQKRVEFKNSGFIQERVDAAFESARLANFQLKRSWDECLKLYETAWRIDESRPESLYFIGVHYFTEDHFSKAYSYFKQAFELGYPAHCQHSLKPTLSFHFLPILLTKTCYFTKDWALGLKSAQFFLQHNKAGDDSYEEMTSWVHIFNHLVQYSVAPDVSSPPLNEKPVFCFLADGGFEEWSGKTILTKGVGGSETYIIEMARHIQRMNHFQVVVFCRCSVSDVFEGVVYRPVQEWYSFVKSTYVHTCLISRFTEYIPAATLSYIENIHVVLHDLVIPGTVLINHPKIKKIYCLTPWHSRYVQEMFPILADKITPFSHGINAEAFPNTNKPVVPYSFIYSSFPDRGLLPLLQMWSRIIDQQPKASLHIFCNIEGEWVNRVQPEQMALIRRYLATAPPHYNIHLHGWTDKQTLYQTWAQSDIWFYPCIFKETFCMTALEAAASRTLVLTNDLAALQDTVGDRGIVVPGDAFTAEWKEEALKQLFPFLSDPLSEKATAQKNNLLNQNAEWASTLSWSNQAQRLCNESILTEPYEYRGLYNWTNGLPNVQDKEIFLKVIRDFVDRKQGASPIHLLEIGTWAGISLIGMMQEMPLSTTATAVDTWADYEECGSVIKVEKMGVMGAFQRNIHQAKLTDRVKIRKGDSGVILQDLYGEGQRFDFIYVDGSHLLLDTYIDCVLAWSLLNKGGVMVIDDYLFESNNEQMSIMEKPKPAVDHFLTRNQGKYTVLHMGYRVFIEKTV